MQRRSHKKSRKGCSECKRRHIRCDEVRPKCLNCERAERTCSYPVPHVDEEPTRNSPGPNPEAHTPSGSSNPFSVTPVQTPVESTTPQSVQLAQPLDLFADNGAHLRNDDDDSSVNFTHLELFHHFINNHAKLLGPEDDEMPPLLVQIMIKAAFQTPYLMHEMLAFSARQLSVDGDPEMSQFYLDQSTKLQTRALNIFNALAPVPDETNCLGMFLFTNLMGMHLMSDTLAFRDSELEPFLTRFLNYLQLHRGVRTITNGCYPLLLQTELEPVLRRGVITANKKPEGRECDAIRQLISQAADLADTDVEACQKAIDHLQFVFDGCGQQQQLEKRIHMSFSWPLLISHEFAALLHQRRPETLVILAYYGAVLHYGRSIWLVGSAGRHIVRVITRSLGPEWTPWLVWPNEAVSSNGGFQ